MAKYTIDDIAQLINEDVKEHNVPVTNEGNNPVGSGRGKKTQVAGAQPADDEWPKTEYYHPKDAEEAADIQKRVEEYEGFRHDPKHDGSEDTRPLSRVEELEKFQINGIYDHDWANADYERRDNYRRTRSAKYAKPTPRPSGTTNESRTGSGKGHTRKLKNKREEMRRTGKPVAPKKKKTAAEEKAERRAMKQLENLHGDKGSNKDKEEPKPLSDSINRLMYMLQEAETKIGTGL